jgi:AcrR family transcriptional regulator
MSDSDDRPEAGAATQEPEGNRAELRRAAFLKAARDVFLEHGYEAANMAEIVRRAGGSLSTLYAQFGGKRGLFLAMVDKRVSELTAQMQLELAAHAPVREGLQRIGEHMMLKMMQPDSLDVFRVMIGQAKKFPDMSAEYFKLGPDRIRKALAEYLADRSADGEVRISDPEVAASVFLDLVRARLHFRALLDPTYHPSAEDIREGVARAVKVFMGGVGEI